MRVVFMGTPEFAAESLAALVKAGHQVEGVYTQPDRPVGRGKKIKWSPVKELALGHGLPVYQPQKVRAAEEVERLRQLAPECIAVVAYGQILPKEILMIPRYGCINVHASLLPKYRGAAPIHWALLHGEEETGVTTMLMDEGLDTGDMLLQTSYRIQADDTTGALYEKLGKLGASLLLQTLRELEEGGLEPQPQPDESTYAPLLTREHEKLDWAKDAATLCNQVRGLNPWPGAYAVFREETVKIWSARVYQGEGGANSPGRITAVTKDGLVCAVGQGFLELLELQPAGRGRMKGSDFYNGKRCRIDELFT